MKIVISNAVPVAMVLCILVSLVSASFSSFKNLPRRSALMRPAHCEAFPSRLVSSRSESTSEANALTRGWAPDRVGARSVQRLPIALWLPFLRAREFGTPIPMAASKDTTKSNLFEQGDGNDRIGSIPHHGEAENAGAGFSGLGMSWF